MLLGVNTGTHHNFLKCLKVYFVLHRLIIDLLDAAPSPSISHVMKYVIRVTPLLHRALKNVCNVKQCKASQ